MPRDPHNPGDRGTGFYQVLTIRFFINNKASSAKDGQKTERPSSYLFIKTFRVGDKSVRHYESVSVKKDGLEVVISNHYINSSAVKNKLTEGNVLYKSKTLSSNSSDRHLAENQNGSPDLLPTREDNVVISGNKVNPSESNVQTSGEEIASPVEDLVSVDDVEIPEKF